MNKIHKPQQTLPPTQPLIFTAGGGGHTYLYNNISTFFLPYNAEQGSMKTLHFSW